MPSRERGFTYLAVLFALALVGVTAALTSVVSSVLAQREREAELLFVGEEYRRAIGSYFVANPKLDDRYPKQLSDLLRDSNHPDTRRHLRRSYLDPMTMSEEWGLLRSAKGGIMGVYSLSPKKPIKRAFFGPLQADFPAAANYGDWTFHHGALASAVRVGGSGPFAGSAALPTGDGAGASAPPVATAGTPAAADDDGLRDVCEILRTSDQGACLAMKVRVGPTAEAECRASAATRASICARNPKGPYPPLRLH